MALQNCILSWITISVSAAGKIIVSSKFVYCMLTSMWHLKLCCFTSFLLQPSGGLVCLSWQGIFRGLNRINFFAWRIEFPLKGGYHSALKFILTGFMVYVDKISPFEYNYFIQKTSLPHNKAALHKWIFSVWFCILYSCLPLVS